MPLSFRPDPVRVRVPASSANLGPGFDTAGLCLSLYDDVVVRVAEAGLQVEIVGEGADTLPRNRRNLLLATLHTAFDRLGGQPGGIEVVCANRIPQSRGLGSSSGAIVAGILAARALVEDGAARMDDDAVLALADEIEGHPDNVAACLRGGFTLAWSDASGTHVVRRDAHPDLLPVALVPALRSSTKEVRGLLPPTVPHADATANAARAALLALAVTDDPGLLLDGTQDRLHQPYRAPAMPRTAALVEQLRDDGVPAMVSGAGPTVLALCSPRTADAVVAGAPHGWTARPLPVDAQRAVLRPLA